MHHLFARVSGGFLTLAVLAFAPASVQGQVIINEVMYHSMPAVPEIPAKEWVELCNRGTNAVDLTGWRFTKGIAFSFTNVLIPSGGYLVVAANRAAFQTNYPGVVNVVGDWTGKLRNNGDTIELTDALGHKVDSVSYAAEGDWALRREGTPYPGQPGWWRGWQWTTPADGSGRTLELVNPNLPGNEGQNWAPSLIDGGTPGRANSVATSQSAPLILDVRHLPAVPKSTNTVMISARLAGDLNAVATVSTFYRVDGSTSFTSAIMFDDGQHGDGIAGDGVYGARLPAQPDKTIVEFYVRVVDSAGRSRTWPAPSDDLGAQGANALYQVDDFGYAGNQPLYRLVIKASEWDAWSSLMSNGSGGQYADAQMNAALVRIDGAGTEVRYCVQVRNRGAGTRTANPHNLHVSVPRDHALQGITRLDFNTRTVHSQVAGNAIFSAAGLHNAYGAAVQVRVNGENLAHASPSGGTDSYQFGSYYCFQPYDSEWAQTHVPQDASGDIYKAVWYFDGVRLVHGGDLEYLGSNVAAYRQAYSPTGPTSTTGPYSKQSNVAEDDWSDLINLTYALSANTPAASYVQTVNQVANVDQWLRYIAVNSLIINMETTLATGAGDDYSMYRGVTDPRFQILNHDLDTVLGQGDTAPDYTRSLFQAAGIPALDRLLKHPEIAPRYFAILKELADTLFVPDRIGPIIDQTVGGWVPADYIQRMKSAAETRRTNVLAQIPLQLTAQSGLPLVGGLPRSTTATTGLSGSANAIQTRSILVNGLPANYVAWQGTWTASTVALTPGLNRILIQALDASGSEVAHLYFDVWYDTGTPQTKGGTIATDTTWTAAGGPYNITTPLTVANGATLTIQPGSTLYFAQGVTFTVANGGRLLAEGTSNAPISFLTMPGSAATWNGLTINGSVGSPETRIAYAFFASNNTTCIEVAGGTVYLDHTTFGTTTHQYLSLDNSSFLISRCIFPSTTAAFELVHGTGGIKAGGRGIVRDCFFGTTSGYNDIMDFTGGNRDLGQPIIQYYNNVFIGASDDVLDLDGTDAWIEGNIFLHVHKNGAPDSSSAVSGGNYGTDTSEITIVRNLFFDCDDAVTAKQGNFYTLFNNTIVHTTKTGGLDTASGVVNMRDTEPDVTTFGAGCYLEGNIIVDAEQLVRNYDPSQSTVTFSNNIMPFTWTGPGGGNSTNDPLLKYIPQLAETQFTTWEEAQIVRDWFSLRPGSPALGTGPNGLDLGAIVPGGASVSGEPAGTTASTTATLTAGTLRTGHGIPTAGFPSGSGYSQYKWRLDGGAWSGETPISMSIELSGLADGPHQVEVVGRRDSGLYQDNAELGEDAVVSQSRVWTVDTTSRRLVVNELLADNQTAVFVDETTPDLIELYNAGASAVDLSGMSLTDDPLLPAKFTFAPSWTLGPGGYCVLIADNTPGTNHTGFALNKNGGGVYLFDKPSAGGALVDSITYGVQLPDLSLGRIDGGAWGLTRPTFGSANVAVPTADPHSLRINEWLTASTANPDFIELFNPEPVPADLGGCYLTDNPVGWPAEFQVPRLSFIAANGLMAFTADGQTNAGHVNFKLAQEWGAVGLFAPDLSLIDQVLYGPQTADVSMGRSPNGADQLTFFPTPTPGLGNPGSSSSFTVSNITVNLMSYTQRWKYNQNANLDGVNWTASGFDDSAWPSGPGLLAFENNTAITPLIKTTLSDPRTPPAGLSSGHAYYFRTTLNITNDLSAYTLNATFRLDDGAVIYLNGAPVKRIRMPNGVVTNTTWASDMPPSGDAAADEYFTLPGSLLQPGTNVLAVEVHQVNSTSSDVVWGLAVDALLQITNYIQNTVVINEVLANNRSIPNPDGTITDWVELYNPSATALNLSGMSFTDDPAKPQPHLWTFPTGVSIESGGRLVVRFDPTSPASTNAGLALNTGFGLDADGDKLLLYRGAALLDAISFGAQAQDYSISRLPEATGPWSLSLPTPGSPNLPVSLGDPFALRLNEWMANPKNGEDWFEIYNPSQQPVALAGLGLTDDLNNPVQYSIPPLSFVGTGPFGAYAEFHADGAPANGPTHTTFKLAAGGESLAIFTSDGLSVIDSITFGAQLKGVAEGRFPDGSTNLVRFTGTATPGSANFLPFLDVLINEALPSPADGGAQMIELFNQTDQAFDLSGCWLSDDVYEPKKFRLSDPAILAPNGFVVLDASQFNPLLGHSPSFALEPIQGGKLFLSLADAAGNLTGYRTSVEFGAAQGGVAFGQYESSTGPQFVAMSAPSFGTTNPTPLVGPVVINEIHYHPPDVGTNDNTADEFIELLNITGASVALYDPTALTNTWHLRNAIDFDFPVNSSLPAGGYLLVVSFDPLTNSAAAAAFRQKFMVPAAVPLFGPWQGKLSNGGDTLELNKPATPINSQVPRVLVERIKYQDGSPWPTAADGTAPAPGLSLQRRMATAFGNDPVNWVAALPTAGAPNNPPPGAAPDLLSQPESDLQPPGGSTGLSVSATGTLPLFYQWRLNGMDILEATNATISLTNLSHADAGRYSVRISNPYGCILSSDASLSLEESPVLTRQPANALATGGPVTFSVVARGTYPLSYQWRFKGTNLPGATNAQLLLSSPKPDQAGEYSVLVANAYGSVTSAVATLSFDVTDSDQDGIPDAWMTFYFGHSTGQASDNSLANQDADGDGLTNLQEYWAGTDPLDPSSTLRLTAEPMEGSRQLLLSFQAVANHGYVVQRQSALGTVWTDLTVVAPVSTNRVIQVTDQPPGGSPSFYRVLTHLQ